MEISKKTFLYEKDRNIFITEHYNSLGDYALLAILIDDERKKTVPLEQVEALIELMKAQLEKTETGNTRYEVSNYYNVENKDMLEFGGDNKYLPTCFTLKKGITNLELFERIAKKFDKRQLEVVLSPELVEVLLSLLPSEELKEKNYQKVI